jgi:hypothetical protein
MTKRYKIIPINALALAIVKMLTNRFDCVIVFEGKRGLGKSTLAWHIARKVAKLMRQIIDATGGENSPYKDFYEFRPIMQLRSPMKFRYIEYKRDGILKFFDNWHRTCIGDEMVTSAFNRDFWNEEQKNLIKVMNMNRDHCNLFMMCVPQFQVLDNQIKNLTKIRITILRRGLAVMQSPNPTIYSKDIWDSAVNEKIERKWMMEGKKPKYQRLTTFRGYIKFKPLTRKEQEIYDKIKNYERNVMKKDLGISDDKKENDWFEKLYAKLVGGAVKNMHFIVGMGEAMGVKESAIKHRLRNRLIEDNKTPTISSYFYDKKARKEGIVEENEQEVMQDIKKLL